MQDSRSTDGTVLVIAALLLVAALIGGGAYYRMQRLQARAAAEREITLRYEQASAAVAEAERTTGGIVQNGQQADKNMIQDVLRTQQDAWNAGNIDQFMNFYWKSDDLTFSSGGKVTRGWQATRDRYKKKYSTRQEMGTLAFDNLEVSSIDGDAALVLGEWKLTREGDDLGGNFSLVFRRIDGRWLIVHDHTSKAD